MQPTRCCCHRRQSPILRGLVVESLTAPYRTNKPRPTSNHHVYRYHHARNPNHHAYLSTMSSPYDSRGGGDGRNRKQSMAELKLRRLQELNARLKEDLERRRIPVSEASNEYVYHYGQFQLDSHTDTSTQSYQLYGKGTKRFHGAVEMGNRRTFFFQTRSFRSLTLPYRSTNETIRTRLNNRTAAVSSCNDMLPEFTANFTSHHIY